MLQFMNTKIASAIRRNLSVFVGAIARSTLPVRHRSHVYWQLARRPCCREGFRLAPIFLLGSVVCLLAPASGADSRLLGNFLLISNAAPEDINDGGLIVGRDGSFGFLLRNGVFTPYVAAPVQGQPFGSSQLFGVNNAGDMVGEYFALGIPATGFLDRHGVITTIASPEPAAVRTIPKDINNRGHIAGFYSTTFDRSIGFILRGSQFDKIEIAGMRFVTILGMNDNDQVVGWVVQLGDDPFLRRGILWSQGQITPIAVPGALTTEPDGIGNDGTIVGTYTKLVGGGRTRFAFVLRNGVFSTIGVPGVLNNAASAINTRGTIVGSYFSLEIDFATGNTMDSTEVGWVLPP